MKKSHPISLRPNLIRALIVLFSLLCLFVGAPSASVCVFGPKGFQRTTDQPNTFQETFTATQGEGQLELFNGGLSSGSEVTSAWVVLNGAQILGPDDFKKGDALLQTPVMLEAQNTLQIRLASNPGTYVVARITQDFPFEEDDSGIIKADLAVTALVLTPDRCAPQTDVSVKATVTNWGRQESGPATLILTMDGNEIGRIAVNPLQVGANASLSVNWAAQEPGRHDIWAHVEPGAGMIDRNPANNSRLATLRVSGESPPVPELEFAPPQFEPGPPPKITLKVRNPSFADISNIVLRLSIIAPPPLPPTLQNPSTLNTDTGGPIFDQLPCYICPDCDVCTPSDVIPIEFLAAGESTDVQVTWPYDTVGHYLVQVNVEDAPELLPVEDLVAVWDMVFPASTTASAIGPTWSSMGPYFIADEMKSGPNTGRISSLAIHPQNPNIIYAAAASFGKQITGTGLWKTTDGGQSWKPLGDKLPQMNIMAIALDPGNPDIVYCASGVWRFNTPGPVASGFPNQITGHIFKSIDGGQTWHLFAHPADGYSKLVVRRLTTMWTSKVLIYAASNRGVLRYLSDDPYALSSQDSEWPVILDGKISDVVVYPTDPDTVFAVKYKPGQYPPQFEGLYQTKTGMTATGNADWSPKFWQIGPDGLVFMDLFKANPKKVYVLTWHETWGVNLWISTDLGDNFNLVYSLPAKCYSSGCATVNYVRSHPAIDNLVYVGYDQPPFPNLLKIANLFGTWYDTQIPDLHADQHAMEFLPDGNSFSGWGYVLGNDGGVYRGKYSNIWNLPYDQVTPINNGLVSAEFFDAGFDVSPINGVMIGGMQDNEVILYLPVFNILNVWKCAGPGKFGDGTAAVIAPADWKTMYAKDNSGLHSHIQRSTDGGASWQGIKHSGLIDGGGPIFTDPVFPKSIYVGGQQVQFSNNGGDDWQQIGPSDPKKQADVVQVLMKPVTPLAGEVLYAGTNQNGQIWAGVWHPGAWTWVLVDEHPDPKAFVVSMAFAPSNPDVLLVIYGNCTKEKRLRRFQLNFGSVWTSDWITGNLPQIHAITNTELEIHTIAAHPTDESIVFVGTDKGVYRGMLSGSTWIWLPYNNGLPLVLISKLISLPTLFNEIRASTMGRGVWRINP